MHVFIEDLSNYIQAARGRIIAEHHRLSNAYNENIHDHIQKRILHNGLYIRIDPLQDSHHHWHHQRRINGLDPEILSDQ